MAFSSIFLAKPLVPLPAESLIVLKNNEFAGARVGRGGEPGGPPQCSLFCPNGVCTPCRRWREPGVPRAARHRLRRALQVAAAACASALAPIKSPPNSLNYQLFFFFFLPIPPPPHRVWINIICLHGLSATSERTGCRTEVGRWKSAWLLPSAPGFCEGCEPSSSSSGHWDAQQPSP